ncbi:PD-(D/E)XK nuclease family protein [Metabacillus rhizolycopersici]|uniref:PD-(D/E)XK nuclease family protein n=1 Tax=Metabacillus rhizolycopersici TaxID=2875709 RepID=A0ABS7UWZ8_9BACI|nr:PD-(D/E)XK nuclease family protein [Metabacillus rhizolycopersici]MBZ5752455.1 PD-(D/E)XK nuclease family protein [Metabacillus rhizolycopersici]
MRRMIKSGGDLPSSVSVGPLKRISPSRYFGMVCCSLREVLITNRIEKLLPSSPNIYFGIAAHQFLQEVGLGKITKVKDFENEWLASITEVEKHLLGEMEEYLVPLSKSVSRYELKKRLLFKEASGLIAGGRLEFKNKSTTRIERWFETGDSIVGGYVDKIIFTNSGYEIIDFKTGSIIDNNNLEIKKEYKYQMLLYAALLYENLNEWPLALKIYGFNGAIHSIKYNKDECIKVLNEAKEMFYQINDLILGIDNFFELQKNLANPAPEHCRFCEFRPICNTYWEKREASPHLNWSLDIRGQFESLRTSGNGTYLLKIRSTSNNTYKVRGLKPSRHQIPEGGFFSIYNLSADTNDNCFSEKLLTKIYTKQQGI